MFGFSGSELFRVSQRDREAVAKAVDQGLRQGVVQPIAGAVVCSGLNRYVGH